MAGMHKLVACVAAPLLASCGDLPRTMDYVTNERTRVATNITSLNITALDVYLNPKRPTYVLVQAKNFFGLAMQGLDTKWAANLPNFEASYRSAALEMLQKGGLKCAVSDAVPMPEQFAIEYKYRCQ